MAKLLPEITKAADVLGHPAIAKNSRGEAAPASGQLAHLVSEADAEFRKVTASNNSNLDPDFVKSVSSFGFPIAGITRGSNSQMTNTMQRFGDSLQKLGVDADIIKEITLSGISNWTTDAGPWLYDLDAPSKKVFPVLTPIRNKISRPKGVGTSHRFRRIDGITGSQTGGVANARISFAENVSTSFRGLSLNRPGKVTYSTSTANILYTLYGISDDLTWASQYAGQGFEDLRGLISRNTLLAHMMGEEQLMLSGRITAIDDPLIASGNVTQRAAGTGANAQAGETAITGQSTSIYVSVTAIGHFGESVESEEVITVTVATGNVVDVTLNTLPAGAHGFRVYVGTGASDPGSTGHYACSWNATGYDMYGLNYTGGNVFTISGALPTTGANPPATDTSGNANDFDGLMTQTNANGLVVPRLNGPLTLDAITKNVFLPGWLQYKSDVDEAWVHAIESIAITDLTLGASGNPYRINVGEGDVGVAGGYRVDRLVNKVTGKFVAVTVHPYMEQGNILFLSYGLPFPNSEVPNVWEMRMVQDYMQIDWPVIQMSYDTSTFTYGSLIGYAPAYNAVLSGVQAR